jgi:hypothetical protein
MLNVTVAQLSPAELKAIRDLEKSLGDKVCLLAVEKASALYALEAKMGPNHWERIDLVYPEIDNLSAFFRCHEDAHDAKAALKSFLNSAKAKSLQKRPIRIRLSVPVIDD